MRVSMYMLVLTTLLLTACLGGDNGLEVDFVGDAENCEELAAVGILLLQRTLIELEGTSISDLTGEDQPESIRNYEERKQAIRDRANELQCSPERMDALIIERTDRLTATGAVPEAVLQEIEMRGVFDEDDQAPTEQATETN